MRTLLLFTRRYMAPYTLWYVVGTVCLVLTNWLSVEIPLVLAEGIDALSLGEAGRDIIVHNALLVGLMGLGVIVVRTGSRLLFFTPGRLVEAKVKQDIFEAVLRQQPTFMATHSAGDLMSRSNSDANMIRLFTGFTALGLLNTFLALGLAAVQMVRLSPTLALAVAFPLLVGFAFTQAFARRIHEVMRVLQVQTGELSELVLSSYQGVATIQSFGANGAFLDIFRKANSELLTTTLRRANLRVAIGPALGLAAAVDVFILLWMGGPQVIAGDLSIGELVAFTTLVGYLTGPLRGMSFIVSLASQASVSMERIEAILNAPIDRPERAGEGKEGLPAPARPPAIIAKNLHFSYPAVPGERALDGLNFTVPAGGTLGIVGPTGSGKTTLLRLLLRLYNPPPGTLFIDGVDVLDIDLDAWRRAATLVPQRAFLFSESVRDNIQLGIDDSARLDRALSRTALRPDLEALPHGLDTVVGEAGLTLSGGQRQRTALARGLMRDPALLALDDVLSAVDHATEHELLVALDASSPRPTTVLVAHRLSAVRRADVIIVLEGGCLAQVGTHDDLIRCEGLYSQLWERQREGEEVAK